MAVQTELETIRRAVGDLTRSVSALQESGVDPRDLHRLEVDVRRVVEDVAELTGPDPAPAADRDLSVELLTYPDHEPAPGAFDDCADEGVGTVWSPPGPAPTGRRRRSR